MYNSTIVLCMHLIVMNHLCSHFDSHVSTFCFILCTQRFVPGNVHPLGLSFSTLWIQHSSQGKLGPDLGSLQASLYWKLNGVVVYFFFSSHNRCMGYAAGGRVVFVNAELHTLAEDATPDFVFKTGFDAGTPPYCR